MWNRRKEEEYQPKPATPSAPVYTPPAQEGMSMSTMPSRFEAESRTVATIGKSVTVTGNIYAREDLLIDGEVEGQVELQEHKLTIGANGKVKASIRAREIVIIGAVNGDVEASDRIEIKKEARLVGDIKTARIVIDDGAYFKGSIDIIKTEVPKAAPAKPAAAPAPAAPAQQTLAASATPEKR